MNEKVLAMAACLLLAACAVTPGDGGDDDGAAESGEAAQTSGYAFKDGIDKKIYPSKLDRSAMCPTVSTRPAGYEPAKALSDVTVDTESIPALGLVPRSFKMALIIVHRIDGKPRYKYLSNGTHDEAFQPWSSTKFIAAANAAAHLRRASGFKVGLDARAVSNGVPLGDMVTNIETYLRSGPSSNGLSRYMHDIGGRREANALVHDWLGRPSSETFGGNYGEAPPDWGYDFEGPGGRVHVDPDRASGYANRLSALTLGETLKRLVMHREDATTRMPDIQQRDLEILFYGAETSKWFPSRRWGGMSADKAIWIQSSLDIPAIEQASHGTFRIFSKAGHGDGEYVSSGYVCAPSLDAAGKPIPDVGKEFFIAARLAEGGGSDTQRDALFAGYHKKIIEKVMDGTIR